MDEPLMPEDQESMQTKEDNINVPFKCTIFFGFYKL